ncbi:MAG: glycosyltransferase, partial [Gemmatimonadales bacterium]|nr:glycosyltransferase [Gemmatimonadales bacterium]
TDETAAVAEAAGARVIRQSNGGPASARNTGIRAATTEWVVLLDADDLARPSRLAQQAARLGNDQVAVVFGGYHVEGKVPPAAPTEITFDALWTRNWIPTSTVVLRRAAWEAVGGFDEARDLIGVEDYNLWLRLAHAGWGFNRVDEILVDYRPTPASLTAQTRRFAAAELANARKIALTLGLAPSALRAKEFAIYKEYGFELFHVRDLSASREFLHEAARRGPIGWGGQLRRLATYLPLPPRDRG